MWFQRNIMSVDDYKMEFKSRVELCEAAGLIPWAKKAAANIVAEEENIKTYSLTGDNIKEYLKKGGKQWRVTLPLSGLKKKNYGALKQSVKKTWLTQQVNDFPK